ncbi:MAG: HAD-IC family P-type ATPase, partial [Thermodesulfobacteriota bacterium]|nr:HAD-IC family P-type ATPase [Thermodesulfobacteriota bacterium]
RIVQSLKRSNEIVAMTGDGVNDAPALKHADIAVAMGRSGTDIAKDASEMVITDDSFSTIVTAVMDGRAIYDNIKKFILYAFSGIAAEFLVVVFSLLPSMDQLLSAIQILWIDLGTEVLPALALRFDPSSPDIRTRKPRKRHERLIERSILLRMIYNSLIITLGTIALFFFYKDYLDASLKALTIPFVSIITYQMINIFTCRNLESREHPPSLGSNLYLLGAVGISILATVLLVSIPLTAHLFHIIPLSPLDWLITTFVAMSIILFNSIRRKIEQSMEKK